ncbi:MAG TPA: VOC family protein [Acidimicrobiales bacterium]
MADPFDALRVPSEAQLPDPEFSDRLRSRLLKAFDLPKGVTVSDLTLEDVEVAPSPAVVTGEVRVLPYLAVAGAQRAIDWYREALGARLRGSPIVMPDGRIGHAELEIPNGGLLMLSEEYPEIGVVAPSPAGGVPVTIYASVPNVDEVVSRAVDAGASLERDVLDYDYGRNGVIRDPFGHRWLISTEPSAPRTYVRIRHGDVGYASLWVRDAERASRFFSEVLGWEFEPNDGTWGWAVRGLSLPHGIDPRHPDPTLFLCYAVADLGPTLEAVRASGGSAAEPVNEPWGPTAMCRDNQGLEFALFEPPGGVGRAGDPPPPESGRPGDLAYITMYVPDSSAARDFYGSVLGWRWRPGRVEDGWGAEGPVPMTGLSGGHERSFIMPMYRVDDIQRAVGRVRALGGQSTDPEQQPYGISAECEDDQGTRFYLGQL